MFFSTMTSSKFYRKPRKSTLRMEPKYDAILPLFLPARIVLSRFHGANTSLMEPKCFNTPRVSGKSSPWYRIFLLANMTH